MSIVNMEKIINGTPEKVLINGYNKMKENYTEASAQDFYQIYSNEPLSFLFENSRMIFSEPFYGCDYYKEAVLNNASFLSLESELEKVSEFLDNNGSLMSNAQKSKYYDLKSDMKTLLENTHNTRIYAEYIKEKIDDTFESNLSNALFKNDSEKVISLFENVNPVVFFTYAPYVMKKGINLNSLCNSYFEKASVPMEYNVDQWRTFVETTICENKLSNDSVYSEAVNNINNRDTRSIFNYFIETSLNNIFNDVIEERVNVSDVIYSSPDSAINNIFSDMFESAINFDTDDKKDKVDTYKGIIYETYQDIISREYQSCDKTEDDAKGYTMFNESMSIEDMFAYVNTLYNESCDYMTEASKNDTDDEDVSDDDVDNMENDVEDREVGGQVPGKKPKAPKPKNLANKIQFNAMDKEAKWQQKRAIARQKGQERFNAARAVMAIPQNIINDIKTQAKAIDTADDERRKKFMTEPGFRKKAFRNLKLAVLYGTAAHVKLSLVPLVAICRHWSKKKDARIRNELVRELTTDLEVCKEKISDASANNDTKEKYRLMRIRDRLSAEIVRVKANSKYV